MSTVNRDWCRTSGIGPETTLVRAVDRDQDSLCNVVGNAALELLERHEGVLPGERRMPREVHVGVLAELPQRERRGEQRAERVAVRVLVRRDEEAIVGAQRLDDRVEVSLLRRRGL